MVRRAESPPGPLAGPEFQHELEMESLRARRGRCPLSLALFAPVFQDRNTVKTDALELIRCIRTYASPCDSLGLLPEMRYALVLPGAGIFRARNIAKNILERFESSGRSCAAGIAGAELPEHASAETLLRQAVSALRQVRPQDGGISVYREQAEEMSLRKTLVHSHEKRFLFSGGE